MKMNFKNILEIKHEDILGLDIGSYTVKMVQLRREQSGFSVVAAAKVGIDTAKVPEIGGIDIGVIKAIQECFRLSSAKSPFAVCSVCGPEVAVRYFKFPPLPKEEINGAIMLEAAQVCPFNINESAVDYQIVPNGHDSVRGIFVAATDRLVQKKKWFAEEASLRAVLMDVDGLALLNCLQNCEKTKQGRKVAVMNVGSSFTTLAIVDNDNLPFIRDIAYAGSDIIGNLATTLGVETAVIQKHILGVKDPELTQLNIKDALPAASQKLIEDVSETIRYYSANEKTKVDEIYVSGGFALVDGFVEIIQKNFTANVQLWNPFEFFSGVVPAQYADLVKKEGPALAVAAGLAMRMI